MGTIIVVTVVVFLLIILLMGLNYIAVKSQTPRRLEPTLSPDVGYEDVTIVSEGATLKAWFIHSLEHRDQSPLIILVHGWGSSKQRMLRYTEPLLNAGYALLLFDVRGHGESDVVKICSAKIFKADVLAVLNFAQKRPDVDRDRIGILAHSFGAFSSVIANAEHIGIKALVTDAMPTRFETMVQASLVQINMPYNFIVPIIAKLMYVRAGITKQDLKQFSVPDALNEQKSPLLLIHSRLDDFVPVTELTYLIEQNTIPSSSVDYILVESRGHSASEQDPMFWKNVLPFFKKHV